MKRTIALILILSLLFISTVYAATPDSVQPMYTYASNLTLTLHIRSNGLATILVNGGVVPSVTNISITTYLEKKNGTRWSQVNIGTSNNTWEYTTQAVSFCPTYTSQLSTTGEYRAVSIVTLKAATIETITLTDTATYP